MPLLWLRDGDGSLHEVVHLAVVRERPRLGQRDRLRPVALLEDPGVEGLVVGGEAVRGALVQVRDGDLVTGPRPEWLGVELEVLDGDRASEGRRLLRRAPAAGAGRD